MDDELVYMENNEAKGEMQRVRLPLKEGCGGVRFGKYLTMLSDIDRICY